MFRGLLRRLQGELFCTLKSIVTFCDYIRFATFFTVTYVIGLLTGHNTLRRHLYVRGLGDNPTCRKCGTDEETSVHILCKCEALASLRYTQLGSFLFGPGGY
jgi:hypothetical protein